MAASVALAAYEAADRTGIGDFVDFSLFAAAAKMTEWAPARALFMGQDSSRAGSKASSPWGIYKCQDGLIQVLCAEEVQWQCLVTLMGKPDWSQLEVFATVADRQANRDLVDMYLGDWFAEKRVADVYHAGQRAGVCLTPVHTMSELGEDSYFRERGFFYQSPEGPLLPGPPYRIDKPWWRAAPPPRSGASRGETWRERRLTRTTAPERGGAQPLEGIRVCDFTWVWAGPFCTQLLAHLGADVIRVESRERPDYFRRAPIHPVGMEPTLETSGVYQTFNSDKRSIAVDLRHPDARQLILDLVKHSDVVIDNFSVGTMAQFGLGVADLRAANPSVVVASLSGYGQTGQRAHYMGYGPVGGAIAGQFTANGYGRGDVMEPAIAVGDPSMGLSALWGLIASLTARRRTGESATLDIAMTEATAATFGELWMEYVTTGENPIPRANHDPQWAPHSCYPAAGDDEWVTIACTTDAEWRALCTVVSPNLVDDKRFADSESRKIHEDELDKHIAEWTRGRDRWVITRKLQAVGVAAFPSLSPLELWSGDRQLAAIGMLEVIDHPVTGARAIPGIPWRFQNARNGLRRPAPLLGQHTDEVLAEVLGLDGATLSDLHDRGVLR
ncbi:hypothetical protein A5695_25625 [Mycobacterium sp. E1747]|nr:hypothetical protein A5695_25625 [Mycobacterium sp. E1747]